MYSHELDQQQATCLLPGDRRVVIACPGSGKTRTLVAAIAKCALETDGGQHIAVVTYTNAAANEIVRRLAEHPALAGLKLGHVGTLHSWMLGWLHKARGSSAKVGIADQTTVRELARELAAQMGLPLTSAEVDLACERPVDTRFPTKVQMVAAELYRRLEASNLTTFDALLYDCLGIMINGKEVPAWPWTHLFWDEAQDSGTTDMKILDCAPCKYKFVVGDPDQSIYGFRGSEPSIFASMGSRWGQETVRRLSVNYRCPDAVIEAASTLLSYDRSWARCPMSGTSLPGTAKVLRFDSPGHELAGIHGALQAQAQAGAWSDSAVLWRTNALAAACAEYLQGNGVPVKVRQKPKAPGDLAPARLLLQVAARPYMDLVACAYLRWREGDSVRRTQRAASATMRPVAEVAGLPCLGPVAWDMTVAQLVSLLDRERMSHETMVLLTDVAKRLSQGLRPWSVDDLLMELDSTLEAGVPVGSGVEVLTMHGAKGQEFDHVWVAGLEEGTCPPARQGTDEAEERRLLYVAMTRARKSLRLSWSAQRRQPRRPGAPPGPMEDRIMSRFLSQVGLAY